MNLTEKKTNNLLELFALKILPGLILVIIFSTSIYHHSIYSTPKGYSFGLLVLFDVLIFLIVFPVILHCFANEGKVLGGLFFYSSFLFMVVFENIWILMGTFHILGEAYTFNIGFLWFFHVPVNVGLGWFFFNYVGYYILKNVFPKISRNSLCVLNGLLALSFDIWIDPTVVNSHLASGNANFWNWTPSLDPTIFTVPIYNFFGWFLGISAFTYIYLSTWGKESPYHEKPGIGIKKFLLKMIVGWVILDVGGRSIPIIFAFFIPGVEIGAMNFSNSEEITIWVILMFVPFILLFGIFWFYWNKSRTSTKLKEERWLFLGMFAYILLNLGMAASLQFAFPEIFLSLLVTISFFGFTLLLYKFILNNVENA